MSMPRKVLGLVAEGMLILSSAARPQPFQLRRMSM